jgi:hypothetical protein
MSFFKLASRAEAPAAPASRPIAVPKAPQRRKPAMPRHAALNGASHEDESQFVRF